MQEPGGPFESGQWQLTGTWHWQLSSAKRGEARAPGPVPVQGAQPEAPSQEKSLGATPMLQCRWVTACQWAPVVGCPAHRHSDPTVTVAARATALRPASGHIALCYAISAA